MSYKKQILRSSPAMAFALMTLSFDQAMAASFDGPDSVLSFHPLCIEPLMGQKEAMIEGGAFDMGECYEAFKDIEVKVTPDGSFYAKRPIIDPKQTEGYVVYKPIGTLDGALELLVYHNKQPDQLLRSQVLVVARLPHINKTAREFITSIDAAGERCNGGIQTARLLSEEILEVDLNSNAAFLMDTFAPEFEGLNGRGDKVANLSLGKGATLDNNPSHCIATVTKTYNLLDSRETLTSISFATKFRPKATNPYQQCFDDLVDEFIKPPATVEPADMEMFKQLLIGNCGAY
jgi:hypothetical protein